MGNRCARLERLSSSADDGYSERLRGLPATFRHFRKPLGDYWLPNPLVLHATSLWRERLQASHFSLPLRSLYRLRPIGNRTPLFSSASYRLPPSACNAATAVMRRR
jgi:hypothetical protein